MPLAEAHSPSTNRAAARPAFRPGEPGRLGSRVLAASLCLLAATARAGEQRAVYDLAAEAAVFVLPAPLQRCLREQNLQFSEGYWRSSESASSLDGTSSGDGRHFIYLDIAAADDGLATRRDAARRFPRRRADARRLYRQQGTTGGSLPWIILEEYERLIAAFRAGDAADAAKQAGRVLHFSVDAALPFNTTVLAREAPRPRAGSSPQASHDGANELDPISGRGMRLRDRFHGALIARLQDRLAYEVRVWPDRLPRTADPLESAFDTLLSAHDAAQKLAALDAAVVRELELDNVRAFVAASDVYQATLAERSAPILEARIEAGALLGATLIVSAWAEAGRPTLEDNGEPHEAEPRAAARTPVPADLEAREHDDTSLVGSLNSTVYHRATCSHCARIKPENTVQFASPADAEAAGRQPCRACKPDVER